MVIATLRDGYNVPGDYHMLGTGIRRISARLTQGSRAPRVQGNQGWMGELDIHKLGSQGSGVAKAAWKDQQRHPLIHVKPWGGQAGSMGLEGFQEQAHPVTEVGPGGELMGELMGEPWKRLWGGYGGS